MTQIAHQPDPTPAPLPQEGASSDPLTPSAPQAPSDPQTSTPGQPSTPGGTPDPGQALQWAARPAPQGRPRERATQVKRYQTQLYLTVQPGQKVVHAVIVRGHSALAYTLPLSTATPADEALIALVSRCRAGDNIHVHSTQPDVRDAVTTPSRDLRRALQTGNRTLNLKRTSTPRSAQWADVLHLQSGGHLDRGLLPNQYHLYVSAITDGRSTYVGAVLHGTGQILLHSRTLGDTDLSAAELKAVQWAAAELPTHIRLDIHASAQTARTLTDTTPEPLTPEMPALVRTVSAIAKTVTDKHISPFVHVRPAADTGHLRADTFARHARLGATSQFTH